MLQAIKDRRPWVAAIICLFAPFLGFAYLNRGRWALIYFFVFILMLVGIFVMLPTSTSPSHVEPLFRWISAAWACIAATHAFFLARKRDPQEKLRWYSRRWYLLALIYYGVFALLLMVRTYLFQPFNVPAASMIPTVQVGDFFLASKSAYKSSAPQRGDIIVFRPSKYQGVTFFKRVIGLPGDRVQILKDVVFINGTPLSRKRISDFQTVCGTQLCNAAQYRETLPSGKSYDVIFLDAYPQSTGAFPVPDNSFFVLGDNRENSADSRNDLGYIRREEITGRAAYKYITGHHWTWQRIE